MNRKPRTTRKDLDTYLNSINELGYLPLELEIENGKCYIRTEVNGIEKGFAKYDTLNECFVALRTLLNYIQESAFNINMIKYAVESQK
jgi:hypothetical protein